MRLRMKIDTFFGVIFLIFLCIAVLFEGGLLAYAYFNADKVECNLLWCTFTQERREISQDIKCYQNGVRVNCTEMDTPYLKDLRKQWGQDED